MKAWQYASLVFLGGCCFGILSTFVKLAYGAGFSIAEVTGGQFIVGTVLIGVLALFSKGNKLSIGQIVRLVVAGIPMGLTGIFYYQSLQWLDASLAIIFLFQFIWIGSLLEWIWEKKKTSKVKLLSITVLLVGSVLAAGIFTQGANRFSIQGAAWASSAAVMFATFIYVSGTVGKTLQPVQRSAWFSVGGLLAVLTLYPPIFLTEIPLLIELTPYVLVLGLFGVALPPLLFSIGMPHVGAGLGTILSSSELPVAIILSTLVLAEPVSWSQWMGVSIILAGIIIGNKKESSVCSKQVRISDFSV
ncbi:EamA family transporter [Halalkalibacter alkalisediminis]|uniref:DMT family transporter n=1 Tax=Halalkalibacter alkalisediminis TaxID=935616 RepID=A0ABV6NBL8_9BACI|nr:DMT family transporter [Halalkalibacter alkalisediminis]